MKKFLEKFASLSKHMNGANADRVLAEMIYENLVCQRDLLLMQNADDLLLGIYDVPGGHVAITELFGVMEIAFHEST